MSIARHHAEWLSLVEVSGPFLSLPVLLRVFPQGLDAHDSELSRSLRLAYEEWRDNQQGLRPEPAIHQAWLRFVLETMLELPPSLLAEGDAVPAALQAELPEHGETLRPDLALLGDGPGAAPLLLVQLVPLSQELEKPLADRRWKASPATRMMELLHAANVRLGLLTNGEHWMLVSAPRGETTSFVSWYAELWLDEPVTQRAFRSLLHASRFFGVAASETLAALLDDSAANQQDVTDQLGAQVRAAVELLIQSLDAIDKDQGRTLLAGIAEPRLYEAALTVMMRLVFLFSAEERGLLRLGDPLYDQFYAVSTLSAQLRAAADQQGEEVLERRHDAWSRLLAIFRAVYGGARHEQLLLPAYGGNLFDPDRFPFLEGRPGGSSWRADPASPLPIDNRTVLHLLEALQILRLAVPGGGGTEPRRLSFRALDIEQIGHVYEGLLDHTAVRAAAPVLGLMGAKGLDPELPLAELERAAAKSEAALVDFLAEATGRSKPALAKALKAGADLTQLGALRAACDNDEALLQRVLPFAGLLRADSFDRPVVVTAGSVYVTAGSDRRATGTHYTPRSLTEPIVQHTLDPLVYLGPADGLPRAEWRLKPARALLELTVCDMAMGSGAFLVQACRYLAERLAEAWEAVESIRPGVVLVAPFAEPGTGDPSEQPLPREAAERLTLARRLVADRCLYGVDKNPLAVEMAKLSLWLITLQKDRPFSFLDHALRAGDSLLGMDLAQLKHWSLAGEEAHQRSWFTQQIDEALQTAIRLRRRAAAIATIDIRDVEAKAALLAEADEAMALVRLGADLLAGVALQPKKGRDALAGELLARYSLVLDSLEASRRGRLAADQAAALREGLDQLRADAARLLAARRPFHWPLEFPEVFVAELREQPLAA
ncbi:MAG TPA: hypothetical protein VGE07_12450, partial [Herpetosiphonaceae bacterium]